MAQNTDGYRKQINNVNDLPGFDKMYLFAGAPTREFDKTFRYFLSCLGNITQDGSSLLDTYHQTDPRHSLQALERSDYACLTMTESNEQLFSRMYCMYQHLTPIWSPFVSYGSTIASVHASNVTDGSHETF